MSTEILDFDDLRNIGIPNIDLTFGGLISLYQPPEGISWEDIVRQLFQMPEDEAAGCFILQDDWLNRYYGLSKFRQLDRHNQTDDDQIWYFHELHTEEEAEKYNHPSQMPDKFPVFSAPTFRESYLGFLNSYFQRVIFDYHTNETGNEPSGECWDNLYRSVEEELNQVCPDPLETA